MFNFLMRFTNSGKISATTEEEQRACLEAVVLTLAGDRRLSMIEQWEFRQLIKRIRWRFNAKNEIPDIWEKAGVALQDEEKMAAYLEGIKRNIFSAEIALAVFRICDDISYDSTHSLDWKVAKQLREILLSSSESN